MAEEAGVKTVQDLILGQLKALNVASNKHGRELASISTIQSSQMERLQTLEDMTREIWENELSCVAKTGHDGVLGRLAKLEDDKKSTSSPTSGGTSINTAGSVQVGPTADGQGIRITGPVIVKYLPWILLAAGGILEAVRSGLLNFLT